MLTPKGTPTAPPLPPVADLIAGQLPFSPKPIELRKGSFVKVEGVVDYRSEKALDKDHVMPRILSAIVEVCRQHDREFYRSPRAFEATGQMIKEAIERVIRQESAGKIDSVEVVLTQLNTMR